MPLTIVTEPTKEPVTLEEAEDHLRLSETSTGAEDTIILSYITAARRYCERFQNRAYLEQTWDLWLETWPDEDYIEIPRPPLISVSYVYYYGTGGTANTMTAGNYYVDTDHEPGRVRLEYGETWPSATLRPGHGVGVRFVAGYGSAISSVPTEIKTAIKMLVGHLYEHREATDIKEVMPIAMGAEALLWAERVVPI